MRALRQVVETGGFSAAGRQLGRAPSSISRQINELEEELGARLFYRTTRKLSLTEAGRLYYERAAQILDAADEAKLAVSHLDGRPSGVLRVTVPTSVGRELVAQALPEFMQRNPAIQVVLTLTDQMTDIVESGVDLAIRIGRQRDSSLKARKIGDGPRRVCASPAYLDRAGTPRTPEDLADHNCLTFREHPGHNVWAFRGPEGASEVRVTGNLFSGSADALAAAAAAGLGIVLLPEWNIGTELRARRVRALLPDYRPAPATSPIYAVYPPTPHLAPKVRAFIDFLVERSRANAGARGEAG
ncbi:MAG: LysR substrate-binding domain-containing protein [Methyloligellaceae bacterium]